MQYLQRLLRLPGISRAANHRSERKAMRSQPEPAPDSRKKSITRNQEKDG
jgi:hypothetical protein